MALSVDQFEEAKEANQKWKYSNERTSESWRKVEATATCMYGIAKDRVESWERRCNDSTCSFWLACLFLSNPTCFPPTYQLKCFVESVINEREFLPFRMKEWLDCCMDVCSSYSEYGSDIGFLINQKLFLSTSEYHYYIKRGSETCPISEIAIIILRLSKVYRFIWSCRVC